MDSGLEEQEMTGFAYCARWLWEHRGPRFWWFRLTGRIVRVTNRADWDWYYVHLDPKDYGKIRNGDVVDLEKRGYTNTEWGDPA